MLLLTEDMLRATRRFDASGRSVSLEAAHEREFAQQLASCRAVPATGPTLRAALRRLFQAGGRVQPRRA